MTQPDNSGKIIELSLSDIIGFIRKYFFFFLIVGVLGCIGGYLLSFLYQDQYKAEARLLPEQVSSPEGNLNQLATLAGLSMRTRTEAVRPDLYPDILASNQFIIKLLNTPLRDQNGNLVTLFEFLNNKGDSDEEMAPAFTKGQVEGTDSVLILTREQQLLIRSLRGRTFFSYGRLDGIVSLAVELPDPVLAANCVRFAMDYLINFVTAYRIEKAELRVSVLEDQVLRTQKKYNQIQAQISSYRDSNRNVFTNSARVEEQKLELEFQRTQALYNELMQRLETARLQKEEDAPVIKVLDPPIVPYATSKPRRMIMAASYGIFVGFLAFCYVLFVREKLYKRLL